MKFGLVRDPNCATSMTGPEYSPIKGHAVPAKKTDKSIRGGLPEGILECRAVLCCVLLLLLWRIVKSRRRMEYVDEESNSTRRFCVFAEIS